MGYMKDAYPNQSLIRQDIEDIVGRVVGEIVSAAFQLIAQQFDEVRAELAGKADKTDIVRLEQKIDDNTDKTDDLTEQWHKFQAKLARLSNPRAA